VGQLRERLGEARILHEEDSVREERLFALVESLRLQLEGERVRRASLETELLRLATLPRWRRLFTAVNLPPHSPPEEPVTLAFRAPWCVAAPDSAEQLRRATPLGNGEHQGSRQGNR
jgi:hypothetical protein